MFLLFSSPGVWWSVTEPLGRWAGLQVLPRELGGVGVFSACRSLMSSAGPSPAA